MITPGRYNFTVPLGGTLSLCWQWTDENGLPINLTGCTGALAVKSPIFGNPPVLELTTENGGMTLGSGTWNVAVQMPKEQTIILPPCIQPYDLWILFPGGEQDYLLTGIATLRQTISHT